MLMRLMILVCGCNYEEDEKNQKILVGYGSLAETSVLFTIAPISSQQGVFCARLRDLRVLAEEVGGSCVACTF